MSTSIYTEQDNGNLKLLAEIEEDIEDGEAVQLLLEESPKLKADRFVVIVGGLDDGVSSVVEQAEEVITTITWKSSRNGNGEAAAPAKRRGRPPKAAVETDDAPAPKRRGRPPGSKNKASAAKPGPKAGATRGRGRPPGSKNKPKVGATSKRRSSGFKRNAASDE